MKGGASKRRDMLANKAGGMRLLASMKGGTSEHRDLISTAIGCRYPTKPRRGAALASTATKPVTVLTRPCMFTPRKAALVSTPTLGPLNGDRVLLRLALMKDGATEHRDGKKSIASGDFSQPR